MLNHVTVFYLLILSSLTTIAVSEFESGETAGHSRDYELLHSSDAWEKMLDAWKQQHHQDWTTNRARRNQLSSAAPSIEDITRYIDTYKTAFESAKKTLIEIVNNTALLTGRLKSASSIQEKLVRKNYTLDKLTDVIGLRLTCQTVDRALKIKDLIEKATDAFNITETSCYGMCPGEGKYRDTGYRRIHLILSIKEKGGDVGKFAELQIGTPYTNMWSDWNHDFIYKGPADIKDNKAVSNYSLEMAEYFWKLDEDRRNLPACPQILQDANSLDILRQGVAGDHAKDTYRKLGFPPNACYWWNDMKLALPEKECTATSSGASSTVVAATNSVMGALLMSTFFGFIFLV